MEKCGCGDVPIEDVEDKSTIAMNMLSQYLDAWDEKQLIDDEESELVELFDTKTTLGNRLSGIFHSDVASYAHDAADSMTSFIGEYILTQQST